MGVWSEINAPTSRRNTRPVISQTERSVSASAVKDLSESVTAAGDAQ